MLTYSPRSATDPLWLGSGGSNALPSCNAAAVAGGGDLISDFFDDEMMRFVLDNSQQPQSHPTCINPSPACSEPSSPTSDADMSVVPAAAAAASQFTNLDTGCSVVAAAETAYNNHCQQQQQQVSWTKINAVLGLLWLPSKRLAKMVMQPT